LRPIAQGEPVTIDANEETARELDTFLDAYQHALSEGSEKLLATLMVGRRHHHTNQAHLIAGDPLPVRLPKSGGRGGPR
jgi:hypothetical protein